MTGDPHGSDHSFQESVQKLDQVDAESNKQWDWLKVIVFLSQ